MIVVAKSKTGHELPAHDDGTELRLLARIVKPKRAWQTWHSSGNPTIPVASIPDFDWSNSVVPIFDQNGNGSCVGHGVDSALEQARV